MKKYKICINEAKDDSVGVYLGRFQPVTKAHEMILKTLGKNHKKAVVFLVKAKKADPKKNPFDEKLQIEMIKSVAPKNVAVEVIPTGFFIGPINDMKETAYTLYCGSDRVDSYKKMTKYAEDREVSVSEIKRTDDDISATKVRQALKDDDKKTFEKMTPKPIHKMFDKLKEKIQQ